MRHSLLIIPLLSRFLLSIRRSLENFVVEKRGIKLKDQDVKETSHGAHQACILLLSSVLVSLLTW